MTRAQSLSAIGAFCLRIGGNRGMTPADARKLGVDVLLVRDLAREGLLGRPRRGAYYPTAQGWEAIEAAALPVRRYEVTVFARTVVSATVEVEARSEAEALAMAVDAAQADPAVYDWKCGDGGHEITDGDIDDDLNGSLDNVEQVDGPFLDTLVEGERRCEKCLRTHREGLASLCDEVTP